MTFVVGALAVASVTAHVRLRYQDNGRVLYWSNPGNVAIQINADGSGDVSDGSDVVAVQQAIDEWNSVGGTSARLNRSSGTTDRRDWQTNDLHLVVFDEDNSSGFFSGGSGIVAITPVTFFTSGEIIDADVIFNGQSFGFTTSGTGGRFDIQDVATHELGHLLGLDHSGVCGATMYPYVDSTVILHRSLALDDQRGLRHMYPSGSFGRIAGRVTRESDGAAVAGAHVVAMDTGGRVAGATLTDGSGNYVLEALSAGSYTVVADPLDQPVSTSNLGGGQTIVTDFESGDLGGATVTLGETANLGTGTVDADVTINLGRVADDYPLRAVMGQSNAFVVRGTGLTAGSTLVASDPSVAITNVTWFGTSVQFRATVPASAEPGHISLTATTAGGAQDILVGGLEVTPADPAPTALSPTLGDREGGTSVVISGSQFRPGARVVIGDRIYLDGAVGGCTVVDSSTITLDTLDTIAGLHDVVVIDETGVEGRLGSAFEVTAQPQLTALFPAVGSSAGGTRLLLSGQDFVAGTTVSIDGIIQANTTVLSPSVIEVVTGPGVPGGPYQVTVTAPGGLSADTLFSYVPGEDPSFTTVSPDSADFGGGASVTVLGSGFTADSVVVFGANSRTGAGGTVASTEFVNANTLRTTAPSFGVGTTSLQVKDQVTGQAAMLEAGFTFTGQEDVGDDGGGCAAVIPRRPPSARDILGSAGWIGVLLVLAWGHAFRGRRRVLAPTASA